MRKLFLKKVVSSSGKIGLIPDSPDTEETLRREQEQYVVVEYKVRDYQTLKNYMQVLKLFVDNMPEKVKRSLVGSLELTPENEIDLIRKAIQNKVGSIEMGFGLLYGQPVMIPLAKSISYEEMEQEEFRLLHRDTKAWIFNALRENGWSDDMLRSIFQDLF